MELVRLELKNFLSYREERLDFTGLRMAALVGPNGAGKSSLLDAITWALWGRTSRSDKDPDGLVHRGEKEARVTLRFRLGEALYQVTRVRRRGKGHTLDFQMLEPRHRSLSGTGIRETQRAIDQVLQIDFETFANASFIRQGRADEFTTKTPAERKRILAEILQLDRWGEWEEQAKKRIQALEQELSNVRWRIEETERELQRRPEYEAEYRRAHGEHIARLQQREALEAEREALREAEKQAEAIRERLRHIAEQAQAIEREQARRAVEIQRQREAIDRWRALLERRAELTAAHEALQHARRELEQMEARLQQAEALREQRGLLESRIAEARGRLQAQIERLRAEQADLEAQVARLPQLEAEIQALQEAQRRRASLEAEIQALEARLQALQQERTEIQGENRRLQQEMKDLKARLQALAQIGAECPTCRRPLPEAERLRLQKEWEKEGRCRGDRYRENQARLQVLEQEQRDLEIRLQERRQEREALLAAAVRLEQGEAAREAAREAAQHLTHKRQELAELEARLREDRVAPEDQAALTAVEAALAALGYDGEAHRALRQRIRMLEEQARDWPLLAEAERWLPQAEEALAHLEAAQRSDAERLGSLQEERQRLEQEKAALEERLAVLPDLLRHLDAAREAERKAREAVIAAEQRLRVCDQLARELERLREEQRRLAEEKEDYEELRRAFGRNGVPAMIIEAVLPEIEEEANRLLHRLTDGRLTVRFRTQRETKEGEVQETLDILISDEGEERPYENFSGGERFRVDFAIRLALSRVLARRSGTPLRLLVVDEGFGSQDQAGRERLIEALNAVKEEFSTILVISHLEEFQDAFPIRIEVRKTPAGSRLQRVV